MTVTARELFAAGASAVPSALEVWAVAESYLAEHNVDHGPGGRFVRLGSAIAHALTPDGGQHGPRGYTASAAGPSVSLSMGGVSHLSADTGMHAPSVPKPRAQRKATSTVSPHQAVVDAVREIEREQGRRGPGEFIGLADVRDKLDARGISRDDQDRALREIEMAGRTQRGDHIGSQAARIIPVANTKALKPRDRAAALRIGDEDNHAIAISHRFALPEPASSAPAKKAGRPAPSKMYDTDTGGLISREEAGRIMHGDVPPAKKATRQLAKAGATLRGLSTTEHVAALEAMTDRDEADRYLAGVKGSELTELARHYSAVGRTVAEKRQSIRAAAVDHRLEWAAIGRGVTDEFLRPNRDRPPTRRGGTSIGQFDAALERSRQQMERRRPQIEAARQAAQAIQSLSSAEEIEQALQGHDMRAVRDIAVELNVTLPPRTRSVVAARRYIAQTRAGYLQRAEADLGGLRPKADAGQDPAAVAGKTMKARRPNPSAVRSRLLDLASTEDRRTYLTSLGLSKAQANELAFSLGARQSRVSTDDVIRNILAHFDV